MFKHQYRVLVPVICGLVICLAFYQSSTLKAEILSNKISETTLDISIETLIKLSGISKQVNQFPELFRGSMKQSAQQGMVLSTAEYDAIIQTIDSSVLPADILTNISARLKSELKQDETVALIRWYQSGLGKKITRLEEDSQTEQAYQQMVEQKQSLLRNNERVVFAERFDSLLGATEMTNKIQQNVQLAVNTSIKVALTSDRSFDLVALKVALQDIEAEINPAVEQMVITSFIYSYKSLSKDELIQYEIFLNQAEAKKFNQLTISVIKSSLESAILSWLESAAISLAKIEHNDTW